MGAALVSVAVATRNGAQYLVEQLESIFQQTHQPLEVVVSDDASTDETVEILETFSSSHRLRFRVNKSPIGISANFARAIEMAQGDFVALCDQDDIWLPYKIERLLDGIENCDLVYCRPDLQVVGGCRNVNPVFGPIRTFLLQLHTDHPVPQLLAENWVVSHSLLFRRDLAAAALPFPGQPWAHDAWLALSAAVRRGARFLDMNLQIYREHAASATWPSALLRQPRRALIPALASGDFAAAWAAHATSERTRLADAGSRLPLCREDREFVKLLTVYYAPVDTLWSAFRSFRAGRQVAYAFSTPSRARRSTLPLRPLIAWLTGRRHGRRVQLQTP